MSHLNLPRLAGAQRLTHASRPALSRRNSAGSSVFDSPVADIEARSKQISTQDLAPSARDVRVSEPISNGAAFDEDDESIAYLVISGGTGCNGIVSAFGANVTYAMPVSDNGGSSSEIIRVLGGPSIGDIRSRLIRLIPSSSPTSPNEAIRRLLSHRFSVNHSERGARDEWRDIVEGRSALWHGIPLDRKETIRGFLVYFENELLRRAQKRFSFRNGSVGNYFLTAAHLFFRSVPSAIFLFSSITGSQAHILPALVTNHTVTIAAELQDNTKIVGQCEISHPVRRPSFLAALPTPALSDHSLQSSGILGSDDEDEDDLHKGHNLNFAKGGESTEEAYLHSPIRRVFYINQYGQEIYPRPNPELLASLAKRDVLVYSVGSLWTSIIPCLALRGVASAVARSPTLRAKVLLLNAQNDRETGGYTAVDYVQAIVRTLNTYDAVPPAQTDHDQHHQQALYPVSAFITHLVYLSGTSIVVDTLSLTALGVKCVRVDTEGELTRGDGLRYDARQVKGVLKGIVRQGEKPETPIQLV